MNTLLCIPRIQDLLWQPRMDGTGRLTLNPLHFGPLTPADAAIVTPEGQVQVQWQDGQVQAEDPSVRVLAAQRSTPAP